MKSEALARLDSFPYRHLVGDVMHTPLATVAAKTPVVEAAGMMARKSVSSLVIVDPQNKPLGIVTERDMVRAFSINVGGGSVGDIMSQPVITIPRDVFLFVAMGRMERRELRHLVVVDGEGRGVGMLTSRVLLKLRTANILSLDDELHDAVDAHALDHVREQLPDLALHLQAEDVSALDISSVISAVYCDMTRRAWDMAVAHMEDLGKGPPPAPVSVLVLGSGGRGESMLKPDQDNAIVHFGSDDDDAWFEAAAIHMCDLLNEAGIPYCKGEVMASNAKWRRSLDGWKLEIAKWVRAKNPDSLLMTDIFFDFTSVAGETEPAERLRAAAIAAAGSSVVYLSTLGFSFKNFNAPIGFFGGLKTDIGRIELKMNGMMPIIGGARIMALQHGIEKTSTHDRLSILVEQKVLNETDAMDLMQAHELIQSAMLGQQIIDIKAGRKPSNRVDPRTIPPWSLKQLKIALKGLEGMHLLVQDSLSRMSERPR